MPALGDLGDQEPPGPRGDLQGVTFRAAMAGRRLEPMRYPEDRRDGGCASAARRCSPGRTARLSMPDVDRLWIDAPEIVRLFPTFVWKRRLRPDVHAPIDVAIHRHLDELRRDRPPPEPGRGWQSGHDLH